MLYTIFTEELIGLERVIVKNISQSDKIISTYIVMELKTHKCPQCGTETKIIHDYRQQKIKDIPAFGKFVILYLRKRRYRCPDCGKRFYEENNSA